MTVTNLVEITCATCKKKIWGHPNRQRCEPCARARLLAQWNHNATKRYYRLKAERMAKQREAFSQDAQNLCESVKVQNSVIKSLEANLAAKHQIDADKDFFVCEHGGLVFVLGPRG